MSTTSLYNKIYKNPAYNDKDNTKIQIVHDWLDEGNYETILDIGCGRGHYIKALPFNIIGVEPSTILFKTDLTKITAINSDIMSYKGNADALYCMDVLEHIAYQDIDDHLEKLLNMAPSALYGIANHSDIQEGVELHLIQEGAGWWLNKLGQYYKNVRLTYEPFRYMVIECSV
jgi:SAM-dependent methyltransferase